VIDGRAAGTINQGVPIQGGGDVVGRDGQPRWRWSATLTWNSGPVTLGAFTQYIDDVYENAVRDAANNPWTVKSQMTWNFYAKYKFEDTKATWLNGTTFQVGVRNAFDKNPPFASTGYLSSLYQPQARYWYTGLAKTF
jgi:hypothetical protein